MASNYVPTNSFSDNAQDASTISTSSSEVPSKPVSSNPVISINKISCLYDNCDSLLNRIDELKIRLFDKNILISGITEIMPQNCLIKPDENDFKIEGYNLYTNIKKFPDGRGTGLYIHKSVKAKESTFSFNKGYLESVWAEVYLSETEVLLCGIVYKSRKEKDNVLLKELFSNVSFLNTYTHLLVMGDFNFPDIDWENWSSSDSNSQEFVEIIQDTYLQQHVTQPTRYRAGQTSNCLDLMFTNEEEMIQQVQISDPLGLSDHSTIVFDLLTHFSFTETMPNSQKKFIFDKGDFDSMKQELSQINWEKEMWGLSVNEMKAYTESKINYCIEKYIPSYSQDFFW